MSCWPPTNWAKATPFSSIAAPPSSLSDNIVLTGPNSGLTIDGAAEGGTILDRLDVDLGSYVFDHKNWPASRLKTSPSPATMRVNASWNSGSTTDLITLASMAASRPASPLPITIRRATYNRGSHHG